MRTDVFLTRTGAFLPHAAVGNDDIERFLGFIGGKPSRARRIVLRSNGIEARHSAIDPATGRQSMSNAQLTAEAIRAMGDLGTVDVLATGTSLPDQLIPNHAVMVHGELGWPRLETVSCAGVCLAGTAALKHAWLAVRAVVPAMFVFTAGVLLASFIHRGLFSAGDLADWIWFLAFGTMTALLGTMTARVGLQPVA